MRAFFSCIVLVVFLVGCKKTNVNDSVVIDKAIELSLVDAEGNDLLNPQHDHAIAPSGIKIFYLIEGELQEVYNPTRDNPRNFFIRQHGTEYRIHIFLNSDEGEEFPETFIQWNESYTDNVKAKFRRSPSLLVIDEVWLNDEAVWSSDDRKELHLTLIK